MVASIAEAIHLGERDIPWVTSETGSRLQLVYANTRDGVWVAHAQFPPGFRSQRHKHTGQVFQYTVAGQWRYLEHDFVVQPGSFLYEPAGSVHTQHVLDENVGITDTWSHVAGANLNLDESDAVESVTDAASMVEQYFASCEAAGLPRPNIVAA